MAQKVWVVSIENLAGISNLKLFRHYEDAKTDAVSLAKRIGIIDDDPDIWDEDGGNPSFSFGFEDSTQIYLQPYDLN